MEILLTGTFPILILIFRKMGYSVKVLNCNGECASCYERTIRERGLPAYDIKAILKTIDGIIKVESKKEKRQRCYHVGLHGGEPLILRIRDLERLLKKIYNFWEDTGIQTNGTLITDKHIELFKKYKTNIGISLDGDTAEMNRGRWNHFKRSDDFIQEKTDLVLENMRKCKKAKLNLNCIIVLRKYNAQPEMIPELLKFIVRLYKEFGIRHINTIPCTVYDKKKQGEEQLTNKELGFVFRMLESLKWDFPDLIWQPYHDIVDMMLGYLDQTCIFNECDPFHTIAEQAINYCGSITNCLRSGAAVDGIQILADDVYSLERYAMLQQVSQELGGCKDCRFWHLCYGGCPGTGIDNDWRNRSRFCEAWKEFYSHIENRLKAMMPNLFLSPELYPYRSIPEAVQKSLRAQNGSSYRQNVRFNIESIKQDIEKKKLVSGQGTGHGDRPYGDSDDPAWRKAHPGWNKRK